MGDWRLMVMPEHARENGYKYMLQVRTVQHMAPLGCWGVVRLLMGIF